MPTSVLRRTTLTLGLVAALATTAACSSDATATDVAAPVTAADVVGTWGSSTTVGQAYLDLAADGTLAGSDGCNRVTGTWQAGGKGVSVSFATTTAAWCTEVDTWLSSSVGARLEDGDLLFVDADNRTVGTLQPTH